MMPLYYSIAISMLGVDNLPAGLADRLNKVNELCLKTGGELVSRQIIATIIVSYTESIKEN